MIDTSQTLFPNNFRTDPLASNLIQSNQIQPRVPIGLTQFRDMTMPSNFTDSSGVVWHLAKSAKDSSVEIPNPQFVSVTRWWNHVHPSSNGRVYLYVVEGIKKPRIETETPVMVLYQWFSTCNRPNFTPQEITPSEWYNANVYTSNITDSRVSILNSLCGAEPQREQPQMEQEQIQELDLKLLGGNDEGRTERKTRKSD